MGQITEKENGETGLRRWGSRQSAWYRPRAEPRRLRSRGTHQGGLTELHTLAGAHRQARLRRHDTLTTAVATTRSCPRSLTPPHRPRPRRCIDNHISSSSSTNITTIIIIITIDLAATMGRLVAAGVRPAARNGGRRSCSRSRIWTRSSRRPSSPRERPPPRGRAAATRPTSRPPREICPSIEASTRDGPTGASSRPTSRSGT